MNELERLNQRVELLERVIQDLVFSDRYVFQRSLQIMDGRNIQLAKGTGTQIGTDTDQKLAFFGGTPVVRQNNISDPTGGSDIDSQARTAVNSIIDTLQAYNLIA